jgi:hypothetical protein
MVFHEKDQESAQKIFMLLSKNFDFNPIISPCNHGTDSDEKNVYQWMIAGAQLTWVF